MEETNNAEAEGSGGANAAGRRLWRVSASARKVGLFSTWGKQPGCAAVEWYVSCGWESVAMTGGYGGVSTQGCLHCDSESQALGRWQSQQRRKDHC